MQRFPIIHFHHLRVTSQPRLLRDFHGELLIVSIKGKIEICLQPHDPYLQMIIVRLAAYKRSSTARFFVGVVTLKGGCFQVISRAEAFNRMDRWVMDRSPV